METSFFFFFFLFIYFFFVSGFYQQTDGCTLGGPFSITFSNAYMLNLENNQNVADTQSLLSVNCFCNPNLKVEPLCCVC